MARKKQELVLAGGGTAGLVRRPARRRDWSLAKERKFLEMLAETCNVTLSAKVAKVGNSVCYKRRARDAAFRRAWGEAIAQGYARLEIETLERAINGTMRTIVRKDGSEEEVVEYDPRTALALLRHHRDTAREPDLREEAAAAVSPEEVLEARNNILFKLKKIRVELLGKAAGEADGWGALGCEPAPAVRLALPPAGAPPVPSTDGDAATHEGGDANE